MYNIFRLLSVWKRRYKHCPQPLGNDGHGVEHHRPEGEISLDSHAWQGVGWRDRLREQAPGQVLVDRDRRGGRPPISLPERPPVLHPERDPTAPGWTANRQPDASPWR